MLRLFFPQLIGSIKERNKNLLPFPVTLAASQLLPTFDANLSKTNSLFQKMIFMFISKRRISEAFYSSSSPFSIFWQLLLISFENQRSMEQKEKSKALLLSVFRSFFSLWTRIPTGQSSRALQEALEEDCISWTCRYRIQKYALQRTETRINADVYSGFLHQQSRVKPLSSGESAGLPVTMLSPFDWSTHLVFPLLPAKMGFPNCCPTYRSQFSDNHLTKLSSVAITKLLVC